MKNSILETGKNPVRSSATRLQRAVFMSACLMASSAVVQAQVPNPYVVVATKDNSIYGALRVNSTSNGKGDYLIAGMVRTPGYIRRALVQFDLSKCFTEQTGISIDSVTVSLWSVIGGHHNARGRDFRIYALDESWGEGCSDGVPGVGTVAQPGDATWNSRYVKSAYPADTLETILWSTPGAIDPYFALPLATFTFPTDTAITLVNAVWAGTSLNDVVRKWISAPCVNNGFIIVGPEEGAADTLTAASFYSKDACVDEYLKPTLIIYYSGGKTATLTKASNAAASTASGTTKKEDE
jgi:hypothetical protein